MKKGDIYLKGFKDGWNEATENIMLFVKKCTLINVNKLRKELNAFCNAENTKKEKK